MLKERLAGAGIGAFMGAASGGFWGSLAGGLSDTGSFWGGGGYGTLIGAGVGALGGGLLGRRIANSNQAIPQIGGVTRGEIGGALGLIAGAPLAGGLGGKMLSSNTPSRRVPSNRGYR